MSDLISEDRLIEMFAHLGIDRETAPHFQGRLDRKLLITRCSACGRYQHPPRPICPACWSTDLVPTEVGGKGLIHLVIFLHQGPPTEGVDYTDPYPVATVELDEQDGLRFTATVVGSPNSDIKIGERVELTWVERAGTPTPAFRLVEGGS